jgi:hypothetical protein
VSLFDFENGEALFREVHRSYKFSLLTMSAKPVERGEFAFFCTRAEHLRESQRRFALMPEDFALLNPNTRTCPVFRTRADAELTKMIYQRVPVLVNEHSGQNPWGAKLAQGLFNMTSDSGLFEAGPGDNLLPLYEAKMVHQFDHRWATYVEVGDTRDCTPDERCDPRYRVRPRYWVSADEVVFRASRVPPALVTGVRAGSEEACRQIITLWFAGFRMSKEQDYSPGDGRAADILLSSIDRSSVAESVQSIVVGRILHQGQAESLQNAWPLSQPEVQGLSNSRSMLEMARALIQRRCPRWLLGFRRIARSTDERTVLSAVVPRGGASDVLPICFVNQGAPRITTLLANFNALSLDYAARQKIGGIHLDFHYVKQLPFLKPEAYRDDNSTFIGPRIVELVYTAWDIKPFADDVWRESDESLRHLLRCQWEDNRTATGGHEFNPPEWAEIAEDGIPLAPFKWDEDRRARLRAELDAYYALLYGLNRKQLRYILDPADLTRKELEDILDPWEEVSDPLDEQGYRERTAQSDFPGETFRVLKEKELKLYGKYRTRRLVLEAFEKLIGSPRSRDERLRHQPETENK